MFVEQIQSYHGHSLDLNIGRKLSHSTRNTVTYTIYKDDILYNTALWKISNITHDRA